MRKYVFFDTNSCTEQPGVYPIHPWEIRGRKLSEGDFVTAYMECEEWDGKIVRQGDQWGIELLSEARELSAERYAGQLEGCRQGILMEKLRTLRVLEGLGLPGDLLEEAKRRLELDR